MKKEIYNIELLGAYGEFNLGDDILEELGEKYIQEQKHEYFFYFKNFNKIKINFGGSQFYSFSKSKFKWLLYYIYKRIFLILRIFNRKNYFFAFYIGIGPFNNVYAEKLTIKILNKYTKISFRDEWSYSWAINNLTTPNISLTRDPVFLNSYNFDIANYSSIAVILRDWKHENYSIENTLLNIFNNLPEYKVKFITFGNDPKIETTINNCKIYSNNLMSYKNSVLTRNEFICESYNNSDVVVTMRFHGAILGLLMRRRVVIINIDQKFNQIIKDFSGLIEVIEPSNINENNIMQSIKKVRGIDDYFIKLDKQIKFVKDIILNDLNK